MSKTEKSGIKKSKFITTKDTLTGNVDKVIAPNGFQVGLKSKEGTSSDLLVTGATTLNDLDVTGTFIIDELDIVSNNTTTDVVNITADSLTTANVIDVTADGLTTGGILNLVSDSSDTSARTLVTVKNDNTAATGTVVMHLINDAIGGFDDPILLIESTSNETHPVLELKNTNASTSAEPILMFTRSDSTAEADDMLVGQIQFRGVDSANVNEYYCQVKAFASDVSAGNEGGMMNFVVKAGGTAGTAGNSNLLSIGGEDVANGRNCAVIVNEQGIDCDFRVESDDETHMLFIDGNANRISIGDSTDAPAATLEVTNHATAGAYGVPLLQLNSNDTDEYAVDVNAANIDETVIHITADALTDSFVMDVSADALTDGGILNLVSNSSDTSARTLVTVKNDNTAATGTVVMHLVNDAIGGTDDPILLIESTADETSAILELRNSNASVSGEPILRFNRSDTSAEADDMHLGAIDFRGSDSVNAATTYANILVEASDVTNGNESGYVQHSVRIAGTSYDVLSLGGYDAGAGTPQAQVVINDGSIDCDFRVESADELNMLFVDAANNRVSIGDSTDAPAATLEITNHASAGATGVPLVQLNSNDVDKIGIDLNAANTTAHVVDITADALTTGFGVNITSDSSDNSSRTLLKVLNDNSSATGTSAASFETHAVQTCVSIHNDNTETNFGPILTVNRKSSTVADDMGVGIINFQGLTDGGTSTGYGRISAEASDVTDATPQGKLVLRAQLNIDASEPNAIEELMSLGGGVGADGAGASVVINDLSYDIDFRVESNGNTHMFFVDGGDDTVAAGGIDATNHKDGFAVFNDFNGTAFESKLADGQFGSAEVLRYSPGADDTLTAGQLYFLHTDGTWNSTDADAVATGATQMLGIGLGGSARTVGCVTRGYIRIPSSEILNLPGSGACDGLPVYVSTTAGHLDFTAPSGNNDFVRIVGYAIDDDSSDVLVYFDPDKTHVEITA